jgi:hypothetical protein
LKKKWEQQVLDGAVAAVGACPEAGMDRRLGKRAAAAPPERRDTFRADRYAGVRK